MYYLFFAIGFLKFSLSIAKNREQKNNSEVLDSLEIFLNMLSNRITKVENHQAFGEEEFVKNSRILNDVNKSVKEIIKQIEQISDRLSEIENKLEKSSKEQSKNSIFYRIKLVLFFFFLSKNAFIFFFLSFITILILFIKFFQRKN